VGADRDVVNVGLTVARDTSVMKEENPCAVEVLIEPLTGTDLPVRALPPGSGALRLFDHLREQHSDAAEFLARVLLARVVPAFVLAHGARTRLTRIDRYGRGIALQADHGPGRAIPQRFLADAEVTSTNLAAVRAAEPQPFGRARRADTHTSAIRAMHSSQMDKTTRRRSSTTAKSPRARALGGGGCSTLIWPGRLTGSLMITS
jgi:hypothetical protein